MMTTKIVYERPQRIRTKKTSKTSKVKATGYYCHLCNIAIGHNEPCTSGQHDTCLHSAIRAAFKKAGYAIKPTMARPKNLLSGELSACFFDFDKTNIEKMQFIKRLNLILFGEELRVYETVGAVNFIKKAFEFPVEDAAKNFSQAMKKCEDVFGEKDFGKLMAACRR